jgi:hypothetical protein
MKKLLLIASLAAALPLAAQAESNVSAGGTGAQTATAHLDFTITVPKVLFLQVGTGTSYAANATVNTLTFAVPAGAVGNGTAVVPTGGDIGAGAAVTVRVLGNSGNVSLTDLTTGPLSTGVTGNPTIPWSDITVASAALAATTPGFTNGVIAHPPFNTAAGGGTSTTATTLAATTGLVRQEGSWTYSYANTATVPAGTYGATAANNGIVTYTATAP